jgi:hypothetical protein
MIGKNWYQWLHIVFEGVSYYGMEKKNLKKKGRAVTLLSLP